MPEEIITTCWWTLFRPSYSSYTSVRTISLIIMVAFNRVVSYLLIWWKVQRDILHKQNTAVRYWHISNRKTIWILLIWYEWTVSLSWHFMYEGCLFFKEVLIIKLWRKLSFHFANTQKEPLCLRIRRQCAILLKL